MRIIRTVSKTGKQWALVTLSGLDDLVLRVRVFDAQLFHGLRQEQGSDLSDDGTVCSSQDDGISFTEGSIDQNDVDSCSITRNGFDFKDGSMQFLRVHEPLVEGRLGQLDDQSHQVAHSVTGGSTGRHHGNVRTRVGVLVEEGRVERLLSELDNRRLGSILEFLLRVLLLHFDQITHVLPRIRHPIVQPAT